MAASVIVVVLVVLAVGLCSPALFRPLLRRMGVVDVPNERSSHTTVVLRGAGLAPLLAMAVGLGLTILLSSDPETSGMAAAVLAVACTVGVIGWVEDSRGIRVVVRAALQLLVGLIGAVTAVLLTGAPLWLVPLFAFAIAAYINIANFMDGVNGISSLHGGVVGLAYAALGALTGQSWMIAVGLVLAAAFLSFLPWNLAGSMFLGDVGSYLLGGSIGAIATLALVSGVPWIAVVAPLVIYLADTGYTLVRRLLRGERWYEAHRSHIYQQLTDRGLTHIQVASLVALLSVVTTALGFLTVDGGGWLVTGIVLIAVITAGYLGLPQIIDTVKQQAVQADQRSETAQ